LIFFLFLFPIPNLILSPSYHSSKVSFNSSPSITLCPLPSSSFIHLPLLLVSYPSCPPHPPPGYPQLKLTSSSRRKNNHRKHGSQGMRFGSHHDTALFYSHSFVQVGINGFGRIGRIVSCSHRLPLASPPGRGAIPSLS
jgi:hypothetical protein